MKKCHILRGINRLMMKGRRRLKHSLYRDGRCFYFAISILVFFVSPVYAETPLLSWNYESGSGVWSVATSIDGKYTATGSWDHSVYFFDSAGNLLWEYKTGGTVWSVSISGDGRYVAVGSKDGNIYLLDSHGNLLWKYKTGDTVWSVSISGDGRYVAAGSYDDNIYFFDSTGKLLWRYKTEGDILGVSVSSKGEYIVAGSWDHNVYFFDSTGKLLWRYMTGDIVLEVSLSGDGRHVVAGTYDHKIYFLGLDGKLIEKFRVSDIVLAVAISKDGRYIAAGSFDHKIYIFDSKGNLIGKHKAEDEVWDISISSDGSYIVAGSKDNNVYFFNSLGELLWKYNAGSRITAVSISADGEYTAFGSYDNNVYFLKNAKVLPPVSAEAKPEPPNLVVQRRVSKASLINGDQAIINIVMQNIGEGKAINVKLEDILPEGLELVKGENSWEGNLEAGQSIVISYTLKTIGMGNIKEVTYQLPELYATYEDTEGNLYHAKSPPVPVTFTQELFQRPGFPEIPYQAVSLISLALVAGSIIFIIGKNYPMGYRREAINSLKRIKEEVELEKEQRASREVQKVVFKGQTKVLYPLFLVYKIKDMINNIGRTYIKIPYREERVKTLKQLKLEVKGKQDERRKGTD